MLTSLIDAYTRGANVELVRWRSWVPRPEYRRFYATPAVAADLDRHWKGLPGETRERVEKRRRQLHVLIQDWCGGAPIDPEIELKPLTPLEEGIWEFRTNWPRPGSRLLGVLPAFNVFIAFGLYRRDTLGRAQSEEWSKACKAARRTWDRLFSGREPLRFYGELFTELDAEAFWDDETYRGQ